MTRLSRLSGLLCLILAACTVVSAGDAPSFVQATFEALAIEDAECPNDLVERVRENVKTRCGRFQGEFRQFKKSWRRWIEHETEGAPIRNRTSWVRDRDLGRKMYLFSGPGSYLVVADREGTMALAWIESWPRCESAARREGRSWIPKEELRRCESPCDYREPERTEYLAPSYPAAAREDRVCGAVLLWTVIDEKGRPGNFCLLGVTPSGYGFEESARGAIEKWRYAPAERNGEPIAVSLVAVATFHVDTVTPPLFGLYEPLFLKTIPE
jgi:TonB family protein